MKKWLRKLWYPLLLVVLVVGVFVAYSVRPSDNNVQPIMAKFSPQDVAQDDSWIAPLKSWVSYYVPGEVRRQTLRVHAPATYTMFRDVTTEVSDNGTLDLTLDNPMLLDGKSPFKVVSEYPNETPRLKSYDPNTRTARIVGFAPMPVTRVVQFTYTPDFIDVTFVYGQPMGTDSGRELVNWRAFDPAPDVAWQWVQLSDKNSFALPGQALTAKIHPMETKDITVTIQVPSGTVLPDNWEFRISVAGYLGVMKSIAINVSTVVNCKFLVSSTELETK